MIKYKLAALLLFVLPVTTLAGTISSLGEKNYSSIEEYQGASKQSNVATLSADEHDNHTDWNQLTSSTTTLTEGYWYLSEDVTNENTITIEEDADVTLCLNGHTLTFDNINGISIENNTSESETTFTLSDCSEEQDGEICFSDDIISDSNTKYILGATNNSSNSSIEINLIGGTINATSTSSAAYGLYTQNNGSFSNTTIDINIDGGFINATTNAGLSTAVRAYIYGNSTTYTQNSSININMISGGIYASSSSYAARSIFGNIASNTRYCSIALTISGGTLQYGEGNSNSAGFYLYNVSSTTSTISTIINGGYHDYSNITIDFIVTVVVNAGYFTDGAYDALSSYVPDSSILKTFTSTDDALALDGEFDENYPNAVYVKGSEADVSAPSTVCVGTDVEQYILVNNNSSLSVNYSYTGTTSGDGLPTEIGEYEVTLSYEEHVSGNTPKEYFESGSSTIDLTIADHTPGSTYLYTDTNHWLECINTYCDLDNSIGLNNEEHTILYSYDEDTHYAYCEICDLVGEEEEHTMIRRVCRYCGYSLSGQIRNQTSIWYVVIIVLIVLVFVFLVVAVIIGKKKRKKLEPGYVKTEKEKNKELKDNYKKIKKEKNKKLKEDNKKAEKEKDKAEKEKAKKLKEEQKRAENEKKKAEKEKIKAEKEKNKQKNK